MEGTGRSTAGGATRARLLAAASALFAERGYDRATVRDIAARAGVNQALLFRHFGSKQALFGEVVAQSGQEQLRGTPPERLVEVALRSLLPPPADGPSPAAVGGSPGMSRSLKAMLRSVGGGDEVSAAVNALGDEYARVLATLSPAEDGELRADLALSWLLGIGLMRVVVGKRPLAEADPDDVCRLVVGALDRLLEGLPEPTDRRTDGPTG
ncbi:TetR/AcrR family transcriptional regulator [Streptomyces lichenis]|uniref:TetR family transcriptional regulator n=1 Tax=Streptomyces lichenis TaxID=2306967 RepID=A0ABT0IK36_9ACTN|nr:TetR/AcrR family transcriptional regulator [Streptomyces lichenis]MCK8681632.1 TetR family transcriptional regulator [Streptomyces lichenis]